MPVARTTLLLLPQAGVVVSCVRFHESVLSAIGEAAGSMALGLLTYTLFVVALGLLVLAVNVLVAMALLETAAGLDARGRSERSAPLPGAETRSRSRSGSIGRRRHQSVARRDGSSSPDLPRGAVHSNRVGRGL